MDSDTAVGSFDVIMPRHLRRASLIQLCNCGMITPPASRKKARGPGPAGSRKYRSLSVVGSSWTQRMTVARTTRASVAASNRSCWVTRTRNSARARKEACGVHTSHEGQQRAPVHDASFSQAQARIVQLNRLLLLLSAGLARAALHQAQAHQRRGGVQLLLSHPACYELCYKLSGVHVFLRCRIALPRRPCA